MLVSPMVAGALMLTEADPYLSHRSHPAAHETRPRARAEQRAKRVDSVLERPGPVQAQLKPSGPGITNALAQPSRDPERCDEHNCRASWCNLSELEKASSATMPGGIRPRESAGNPSAADPFDERQRRQGLLPADAALRRILTARTTHRASPQARTKCVLRRHPLIRLRELGRTLHRKTAGADVTPEARS